MRLPPPARAVVDTWLSALPDPGLVTGLYVRGGLGFGEFIPGQSDVDFVATLSRRPTPGDLDALAHSHVLVASAHPDQPFDGAHLLASDLAGPPDDCPDVPCVLHHHAEDLPRFPEEAAKDPACSWCVLGVARLHHLLVTGEMTTKSGAGLWGLGFYDERFHRVLREALRLREGVGEAEYVDPADRGRDVADFTAHVVDAGTRTG